MPWNTIQGESWFIRSLTASEIKLAKGIYKFEWSCTGRVLETYRMVMYKDTPSDANTVIIGNDGYSSASNHAHNYGIGTGYLEVDDEDLDYGIAGEATATNATGGWGYSCNFYDIEVYNEWKITKLA